MVVANDWHSALVPMLIHAEKSVDPGSIRIGVRGWRSPGGSKKGLLKTPPAFVKGEMFLKLGCGSKLGFPFLTQSGLVLTLLMIGCMRASHGFKLIHTTTLKYHSVWI